MSINWSSVYNTPIGQILGDLNPKTFAQLTTQETNTQISTLQNQVQQDSTEISAWTTLQSDAQGFASALNAVADASTFVKTTATSSDPSVATVSYQNAQNGTYTISVGSLAQSEIDTGTNAVMTVSSPTATLTNSSGSTLQGSFSINGGSTITIPSPGESLNGLASQINNSNSGVTATVVETKPNVWTLEIQANQTDTPITYTEGSSGPLYYLGIVSSSSAVTNASAADQLQAPSAAQVSFGSTFNAANAISSSSNTFSNLIPGVTLTAQSTGSTTINVGPDVSSMKTSVQNVVSAWNQWVKDTQNLAEAGTVTSTGTGSSQVYSYQSNSNQVLASGLPVSVLNQVESILAKTSDGSGTAYQTLGDLGITFKADGSMSLNSSTLTTALSNHPHEVSQVFSALASALQTSSTTTTGMISGFSKGTNSTTGEQIAALQQQESQYKSQMTLLKQQMTAEEQNAVTQYGKWVSQLAKYSQQYSLYNALFNTNNNNSNGG
ncbi:flagellar filament capping protein FliD [Sulfobacillus harzensis]|uniref:Flagellar hook-associated protein 2 n=1 Tax=Sulfobacillus harzensis TaxID=2729629 RepID=A0A7Y0L122_9FIRM|nr:flagellar filament capping protein FliD [Sulfobacillus harzensis]NMP21344.1 flagellar filament capping protein FliD [Sulfobacillus harzensis]